MQNKKARLYKVNAGSKDGLDYYYLRINIDRGSRFVGIDNMIALGRNTEDNALELGESIARVFHNAGYWNGHFVKSKVYIKKSGVYKKVKDLRFNGDDQCMNDELDLFHDTA